MFPNITYQTMEMFADVCRRQQKSLGFDGRFYKNHGEEQLETDVREDFILLMKSVFKCEIENAVEFL